MRRAVERRKRRNRRSEQEGKRIRYWRGEEVRGGQRRSEEVRGGEYIPHAISTQFQGWCAERGRTVEET